MFSKIKELYDYRQMILGLVHREIRGRYKGSVLGFLWTFLNPLLQLCVYSILFGVIMKSDKPYYPIFLFVALVPWIFFSTCLAGGCNSIILEGGMVTKIYFPREVLPISFVTSAFINMLYCFVVIFAVIFLVPGFFGDMAIHQNANYLCFLFLPIIMAVEFLMCMGVALLFSALTVYVRDFAHILGIIAMLLQFLTPVMYATDRVPPDMQPIFKLNPMCSVIECYRDILYYFRIPDLSTLGIAVAFGVVILIVGELLFSKLQKGFAEEL